MNRLGALERLSLTLTSVDQKVNLLEDVSELLASDMSMVDIADDLMRFGDSLEKLVGKRIKYAVDHTKPVYTAFEGVVSEITLQTIKAGEESHDLATGFIRAKEALQASEGLIIKLLKAFLIPGFKLTLLLLITGHVGDYIFKQLMMTSPVAKWPSLSQLFYAYSDTLYQSTYKIIAIALLIPIVSYIVIQFVHGAPRSVIDKLPFFKQYRLMSAGASLSTMATLLNADMATLNVFRFMATRTTRYIRYHLEMMEQNLVNNVGRGNIGHILHTGLIDARETNRLKRGNVAITLGARLQKSANEHNKTLVRQIEKINQMTHYIFIFLLYGSLLAFFSAVFFLVMSINAF
ncbi:Toxin coregulated pilus biosynthesis protein E [Vibrio thalassae]|uniref:Toxin coregulated pilus biosynthesis protein E n=1 Tax=Vibrio thalassae TaxID=1243014 RepID=A0A240EFA7_9VIBR|nr:hypothetical protein [Vibrio thalassae]SNX47236.1 Toxin coregulated pilus biosynthesis protein E [Vibrio thalassae]